MCYNEKLGIYYFSKALKYELSSYIYDLDILEKSDSLCYTIDVKKGEE